MSTGTIAVRPRMSTASPAALAICSEWRGAAPRSARQAIT